MRRKIRSEQEIFKTLKF